MKEIDETSKAIIDDGWRVLTSQFFDSPAREGDLITGIAQDLGNDEWFWWYKHGDVTVLPDTRPGTLVQLRSYRFSRGYWACCGKVELS